MVYAFHGRYKIAPPLVGKSDGKKKLFLILAMALLTGCSGERVESQKLVRNGGITYRSGEREPFTGTSIQLPLFNEWGDTFAAEHEYKNGLLHGSSKSWYPDGQMRHEGSYKEDLKHGQWIGWNENGIKLSATIWENGNITQKTGLDGDGNERFFSEQQIENINEDRVVKKREGIVSSLIPDGPLVSDK